MTTRSQLRRAVPITLCLAALITVAPLAPSRPPPHRAVCLAALITVAPLAAANTAQLTLDKGCMNCHGTPPHGKAPTMAELAARYAAARGHETKTARLSARLRQHHPFGGVPAHERLTAEEAERFVRWLADGGR